MTVVRLDAWVINHDIQELPSNGNWMVIAFEQRSGETRERARRESTHGACTHFFVWRGSENAKVEEAPNAPLTSPPDPSRIPNLVCGEWEVRGGGERYMIRTVWHVVHRAWFMVPHDAA